jgi:hypothetical protein
MPASTDRTDPRALERWARELGVDYDRLARALAEVGPDAEAVREHVRRPDAGPGAPFFDRATWSWRRR